MHKRECATHSSLPPLYVLMHHTRAACNVLNNAQRIYNSLMIKTLASCHSTVGLNNSDNSSLSSEIIFYIHLNLSFYIKFFFLGG